MKPEVSMKEYQEKVKDWTEKKGFKWTLYAEFCHLVEEVGELGEAITVHQGERKQGSGSMGDADHSDLEEEIGDILFSCISIANSLGIDISKCLDKTFTRYDKKIAKRTQKSI